MIPDIEKQDTKREDRLSRRQILGVIGAGTLVGVAGCSGNGSSDGDNGGDEDDGGSGDSEDNEGGDESSGSDTGSGQVEDLCAALGPEFVSYDPGATAMIVDFDVPEFFVDDMEPQGEGTTYSAFRYGGANQSDEIRLQVIVGIDETTVRAGPNTPVDEDSAKTVEIGGTEVGFFSDVMDIGGGSNVVRYNGGVPAEINGTTLNFPVTVESTLTLSGGEEVSQECATVQEEAVSGVVNSMSRNPETTIESYINENWDDPP